MFWLLLFSYSPYIWTTKFKDFVMCELLYFNIVPTTSLGGS